MCAYGDWVWCRPIPIAEHPLHIYDIKPVSSKTDSLTSTTEGLETRPRNRDVIILNLEGTKTASRTV
eukprot:15446247-Alexandrium_andersonii.AAC.1